MLCTDWTASEPLLVAKTTAWVNGLSTGFLELNGVAGDHIVLIDNVVPFSFLVATLVSDWDRANLG